MTSLIALAVYFALGLALVFVGPTARLLRREREKLEWQAYDEPRWKLIALSGVIAVGIILLWPFLAISAARIESASKANLLALGNVGPSRELDRRIAEVQSRYSTSLPFQAYQEILGSLPWTDREHFEQRLAQLSYVITGFATGPRGEDFPVAVPVLVIGIPFTLTRMRCRADSLPPTHSFDPRLSGSNLSFRLPPEPNDEVWEFSSSQESWEQLAGRAGLALVRARTVIDAYVTMMN